jgi:predicted SnoaL-like aldol condensation-catalyzing enzyme
MVRRHSEVRNTETSERGQQQTEDVVRRMIVILATCWLTAAGCSSVAHSQRDTTQKNREAVVAFYEEALIQRNVRAGFERYMSSDFLEHKADVPKGNREETIAFLESLIKNVPDPKWEVLRVAAENDLVFVHARFIPAPGAPPYAIADIFRMKDGRIVEHWDVVSAPPAEQRNPHPRF